MKEVKPLPVARKKELELQNKARALCGLSTIKIKVRYCNQCDKPFESCGDRNCGCNTIHTAQLAGIEIV